MQILDAGCPPPAGCVVAAITTEINIHLLVRGLVDIDEEIGKLETKIEKMTIQLDSIQKKTQIPDYEARVRADVREATASKVRFILFAIIK